MEEADALKIWTLCEAAVASYSRTLWTQPHIRFANRYSGFAGVHVVVVVAAAWTLALPVNPAAVVICFDTELPNLHLSVSLACRHC